MGKLLVGNLAMVKLVGVLLMIQKKAPILIYGITLKVRDQEKQLSR